MFIYIKIVDETNHQIYTAIQELIFNHYYANKLDSIRIIHFKLAF